MEKWKGKEQVSVTRVPLKKSDDIKTFAESTMNELLGWYGYDSNSNETKSMKRNRTFSEMTEKSNDSDGEPVKFTEGCGWCGKTVDENTSVISATAIFCSELCFSQSRRASFKRNKACDWCRHSRNAVSYVDFQDNAAQLQFCSDKCLNQYKMHIFCRETKAHLELHPHLHGEDSAAGALITPDLWMKNCPSPNSPKSQSPKENIFTPDEPLPLISIASSSKLLAVEIKKNRKNCRRVKRGCPSTVTSLSANFNDIPQDLSLKQPVEKVPVEPFNLRSSSKNETPPPSEDKTFELSQKPAKERFSPTSIRTILGNVMPPPTTFVPYPIILPLPIPIPIPIPIPKMFKSNDGKDMVELKHCGSQTCDVPDLAINANGLLLAEDGVDGEVRPDIELNLNKRLLRKRKPVTVKPKGAVKQKKTVSNL
ncbi:sine oculis-binding protein homolog B [Euwallacea similis]|uniref:sine oculis-binding protein homolog B n=1 Tax=Euwallacea similis TaxID=1736056 RepID=UPI003450AE6D